MKTEERYALVDLATDDVLHVGDARPADLTDHYVDRAPDQVLIDTRAPWQQDPVPMVVGCGDCEADDGQWVSCRGCRARRAYEDHPDVYEVVNPSDYYTVLAYTDEVAGLACLLLGNGRSPAKRIHPSGETIAFFPFGVTSSGVDKSWKEDFGRTIVEAVDALRPQAIRCLRSIVIGDRWQYGLLRGMVAEDRLAEFDEKWHDSHRSSMNDYRAAALALADDMEEG